MNIKTNDSICTNRPRFHFDRLQQWLHWTMASLIIAAIGLGILTAYLPAGQQPRMGLLDVHKSLGFTIVGLLAVRIVWRLCAGAPAYRQPLDRLTRAASHAAHAALYVLMLFMPITGYNVLLGGRLFAAVVRPVSVATTAAA
jgi:cytochrome b561